MEKRQLNFAAPLLSARRFSSPTRSSEFVKRNSVERRPPERLHSFPLSKSDWEAEPLTKPAAVPFHWEQVPGKPKGGVQTPDEPLNTPKLPPAMISDAIRRHSGEISRLSLGKVAGLSRYNSGEIPRLLTGRVSSSSAYNSGERSSDASMFKPRVETFSFIDHASSDALDSLSRTESSSFNYSVSGLSGYPSSGVKPSAAKAVVLETPQYVPKKPSISNEQPKLHQIKKTTSGEVKPLLEPNGFYALQDKGRSSDFADSEDEEKESPTPSKKSGKVWGILPRFCVKNSLCLFNPLPGMKLKTHIPKHDPPKKSAVEVGRMARTRNAHSGPLEKNPSLVPSNKKSHSGLLPRELFENEKKQAADTNQFLSTLESKKSAPSPLRRTRSGNISLYRNESPKSPFLEGVGFLGVPKQVEKENAMKIATSFKLFKALQDVSRNQTVEKKAGLADDAVEKTKFMDTAAKTDLPVSNMSTTKLDDGKKFLADRRLLMSNEKVQSSSIRKSDFGVDALKNAIPVESTDLPSERTSGVTRITNPDSNNEGAFDPSCLKSPLPPPLPKSPSESWLWRTLPAINLSNPFSHPRSSSAIHSRKQVQKGCNSETKWETNIKSSNIQNEFTRYSEELIPHISH